jgi:integrase/recombinase XerD
MDNTSQMFPQIVEGSFLTSSINRDPVVEYIAWKKSYTSSAHRAYLIWVRRFQEFVNKAPEEFRHQDYSAFVHSLNGRFASKCIEFALNVVHNYLRFFAEQGRLHFPLYLARVPRGFAQSHATITEKEYRLIVSLLRAEKRWRDMAMIMLLHDCGMRIGELLSLEIEDIQNDCSAVIRTEKTFRQRRVFWNQDTDDVLQLHLVERINHGPAGTDALFVSSFNKGEKALSSRQVERMFKDILRRVKITRKLSPHSFRHAFIHRLARLSVPDAIIAQLVGHSTPTTIAHYTKLSRPEFKEYAKKQLDAVADEYELAAA